MDEIESLMRKIKRIKNRAIMFKNLEEFLNRIKEENEILKLQLAARERERDEYKKELDEIHQSISYRVGRRIAETKIGGWLKKVLRKYVWR
jgi:septal ring factor EnvC (AmiA/AmiB activator)